MIFSRILMQSFLSGLFVTTASAEASLRTPDNTELSSKFSGTQLAQIRGRIDPLVRKQEQTSNTRHISIVLVGDTGFAPSGVSPKANGVSKHGKWQNWSQTTSRIKSHINGDINFANMESVVSDNGSLRARPKAFNFMTHPNGVEHLADVGFNLFSMANNHAFDYGAKGIHDSLMHMNALADRGNFYHAGIGKNQKQAAAVAEFWIKDTKFAFASIGIGASGGGLPRATDRRPGQLSIYNKRDKQLLSKNLASAEADYRILSVHRGIERQIRVNRDEINQARNYVNGAANVDLFVGHHAHVTRGVELNQGRVIFYGLGNFLHQGTANMAGSGGCRDYSILARIHLVKSGDQKPELAAIEVVPITATHMRPEPMSPRKAAKRIGILNGLAAQFDKPSQGAQGIRFDVREDGSGLFCTAAATLNAQTQSLCKGYRPYDQRLARTYRAATSSCGSSFNPARLVKLKAKPKKAKPSKVAPANRVEVALVKPRNEKPVKIAKAVVETPRNPTKSGFTKLSNRQLARLSKKAQTRYWTRYWYVKRGRAIPKHLR